jgi:hypothetical protein
MRALTQALELLSRYVDTSAPTPASTGTDAVCGRVRGPLQEAIADLPGMANPAGMKPAEIGAQIGYSVPNTYRLLQALARAGVTELVTGGGPQRWRLTKEYRHSPAIFMRFVATVRPGEWTSCADVSIAARGDISAAWMVCWAASHLPEFPHPHRVLLEGGALHPFGHDHQRERPEAVRDILVREGVRFTPSGCATPVHKVAWDQLCERALRAPTAPRFR